MNISTWSRRELLAGGTACLSGALLGTRLIAGSPAVAASSAATAGASPGSGGAAASGTFKIGGDLTVNRMGFGAMRVTGDGVMGPPKDPAEALRVLRRAVELGVNFIDTADAYGPNISEELIAQALYPYPKDLVIATKGGLTRPASGAWVPDCSPAHLSAACEASLKRLKLERIDVYQLHTVDPKVPLADSIGALAKLQQDGKIRHIGVSNVSAGQLALARSTAKVVSVQNRYNLRDRASDEVLTICQRDGLAFIPWAPLGRGTPDPKIEQVAKQRGISVQQVSLAWLLARSPVMVPIPGTSSTEHLEQNVAAAAVKISPQEMAQLAG